MNNKGFAVTTILYGIMVLFCLLLVSLLSILSSYRKTQDKLIDENNGARSIITGTAENTSGGGSSSGGGGETTTYTITFVCLLGTFNGRDSQIEVKDNTEIVLSKYSCVPPNGYLFMGWYVNNPDALYRIYTVNGSDITFYGKYRKVTGGSSDSTM